MPGLVRSWSRWARRRRGVLTALALGVLLTGCASALSRGEEALRAGRYEDAAREFEAAAARGPSLDALTGLGIARHKTGDLAGSRDVLRRVVAEEPERASARLYLALAELGQRDDARALEDLEAARPLVRHPRIVATIDRATAAIRDGLSEPARRLVLAMLDDALEWANDVRDASRAARYSRAVDDWPIYRDRYYPRLP